MSIDEIDSSKIADELAEAVPETRPLLEDFFQRQLPDVEHERALDNYVPRFSDRRRSITAAIYVRQGQPDFRASLIRRYGPACAISECRIMEIVEAAHIWPYRGIEDNHPENGLLLRSDLHTLYDLDLVGISSELRLAITPSLVSSEYAHLDGKTLNLKCRPSATALQLRWENFLKLHRL